MKKKLTSIIIFLLFCTLFSLFAEEPPIKSGSWQWSDGVTLNGKKFFDVAKSYKEQDGWAYIEGMGKLHYWLYDTYAYHNGHKEKIVDKYVPAWIESMGYVIDFDHMRRVSPNKDLASSVKALMKQRGCDVSVLFSTSNPSTPYVVINEYDKDKDSYGTDIIPLFKQKKVEQKKQTKKVTTNPKSNSGNRTNFAQELYRLRHKTHEISFIGGDNGPETFRWRYIYRDDGRMINEYIVDLDGNIRSSIARIGVDHDFNEMYPLVQYYSVPKEIRELAMKSLE